VKRIITLLFLLLVLVGAAAAWMFYSRLQQPYRGFAGTEQFVEIPPGAGSRAIGDRLVDAGVIRDRLTFRASLWLTRQARHLKAGEYRFDRAVTPADVIDKLARGDVFVIHLTFPEGLTVFDMAKLFESHGFGPASAFVQAAMDVAPIKDLDPQAKTLEGYLFPQTYALPRKTDGPKLVRMMVAQFQHALTPELRTAARARNLTIRELVTLASIVEKETGKPEERPLVASVVYNRLRIGMQLQVDPTVIYALELRGGYDGNIHKGDLSIESPYNTYRYPGLPPGPIASPGSASLEATVHPADADFLYFVSRNDGSHVFARTLDEHNRNVQKYQVLPFRASRSGGPGRSGGSGGSNGTGRR
jgi:UPF0755 protein